VVADIERRPVTVYADTITTTTDEFEGLTYTIDPKTPLAEGDSLTGKLNFEETETEGVYNIVQGTLTDAKNPNYTITFVSAKLTLTSEKTNSGQSSQGWGGLNEIDDFSSLLEQDWFLYAAVGAGTVLILLVILVVTIVCRKRRRG
jgi:hypothetical protein